MKILAKNQRASFDYVLIVLATAAGGFYYAKKARQQAALVRQQAKAPEISITLVEGWTNEEIGAYLEKKGVVSAAIFTQNLKNFPLTDYPDLASKPSGSSLLGYIFPDTYFIPKNSPSPDEAAQTVIKKSLDNFSKKITGEMLSQAQNRGMTLHQILTLASIIEKETGREAVSQEQKQNLDAERKTIAGIFYNRLNIRMPLQSDATVNFVTKKNTPSPSEADTKINSPYNTYKYPGLPPGPICNPSLSSILAALNPTNSDYLYFLHDQKTGQVFYASTYEQHLINKQKYLK